MSLTEAMRKKHIIMKQEANLMGQLLDCEEVKAKLEHIEKEIQITKDNIRANIASLKSEHEQEYHSNML